MIVILGAGLAGLSTALHLERLPWAIYEANHEAGGLCRSMEKDGFIFDYTGHLLYIHHDPVKAFFNEFMAGKMHEFMRNSNVFSHGTYLPFPFQANTYPLPADVRADCIIGFVNALMKGAEHGQEQEKKEAHLVRSKALDFLELKQPEKAGAADFGQWVRDNLGEGFVRHFLAPYNEKFWRRPLSDLTAEWALWSVPVPSLEEVLRGALGLGKKQFGYNTSIHYPKSGGIQVLPDAMVSALGKGSGTVAGGGGGAVRLNKRAVSVNAGARTVRFSDGEEASYDRLVSSIPLDNLVGMIEDAPADVKKAASGLKSVSVHAVNLGVKGNPNPDLHWTYFPGGDYLFYRIGSQSNYSPAMAPEGCSSLTAEVTRQPDEPPIEGLEDSVIEQLVSCALLKSRRDVLFTDTIRIKKAYVVFDEQRQAALPLIFDYLVSRGIIPVGRYGTWNYMGMEDSILHGVQTARMLEQESVSMG